MFTNISTVYQALKNWAEKTYAEAYSEKCASNTKTELMKLVHYVLQSQSLLGKKMDGFSTENLDQTELEWLKIKYALIPDILSKTYAYWTPLDVIVYVCDNNLSDRQFYQSKAKENNMSFEELTAKMCARALRALPSAIREHQLLAGLRTTFPTATITKDADLDLQYHCDAKMMYNGKTYWCWSFIAGKKSINKFAMKFTGTKGSIVAAGYHVLCGFDRFDTTKHIATQYYGWELYPESYFAEIKQYITNSTYYEYDNFIQNITTNKDLYEGPVIVRNRFTKNFGTTKEYSPSVA